LPFADDTFDGCRSELIFSCLHEPARALAEMRRVTRPGGYLVVADQDAESRLLDTPEPDLTRRIVDHYATEYPNSRSGRQLPRLFREAGLLDISVTPHTVMGFDFAHGPWGLDLAAVAERAQAAGVVSAAEAAAWVARLEEGERAGHLFNTLTAFVVAGRKP